MQSTCIIAKMDNCKTIVTKRARSTDFISLRVGVHNNIVSHVGEYKGDF